VTKTCSKSRMEYVSDTIYTSTAPNFHGPFLFKRNPRTSQDGTTIVLLSTKEYGQENSEHCYGSIDRAYFFVLPGTPGYPGPCAGFSYLTTIPLRYSKRVQTISFKLGKQMPQLIPKANLAAFLVQKQPELFMTISSRLQTSTCSAIAPLQLPTRHRGTGPRRGSVKDRCQLLHQFHRTPRPIICIIAAEQTP
jgi:hypothetical protein